MSDFVVTLVGYGAASMALNLAAYLWMRTIMTGGARPDWQVDAIRERTTFKAFDVIRLAVIVSGAALYSVSVESRGHSPYAEPSFYAAMVLFLLSVVRTYILYYRGWRGAIREIDEQ